MYSIKYNAPISKVSIEDDRVSLKIRDNFNYGDWVYLTQVQWEAMGSPKPGDVLVITVGSKVS